MILDFDQSHGVVVFSIVVREFYASLQLYVLYVAVIKETSITTFYRFMCSQIELWISVVINRLVTNGK